MQGNAVASIKTGGKSQLVSEREEMLWYLNSVCCYFKLIDKWI
jgi:hypothetical protein